MHTYEEEYDLKTLNKKILAEGEDLAMTQLHNNDRVQTGCLAAMLHNVTRYNDGERGEVEQDLVAAIPALIKAGIFDLFPPEDWVSSNNVGRKFVGEVAQKQMEKENEKEKEKKFVFPRFFFI